MHCIRESFTILKLKNVYDCISMPTRDMKNPHIFTHWAVRDVYKTYIVPFKFIIIRHFAILSVLNAFQDIPTKISYNKHNVFFFGSQSTVLVRNALPTFFIYRFIRFNQSLYNMHSDYLKKHPSGAPEFT